MAIGFRYSVLIGLLATGFACAGCGHTEQEWQAQTAKYNTEVKRGNERQAQIDDLRRKLGEAQGRVGELEAQLQTMGIGLDAKGQQVETLTQDLEDVRRALDAARARARVLEQVRARMVELRRKLDSLTHVGLAVNIRRNRMVISLPGDVLFDTGKTDLKPEGKRVLRSVADVVRNDPALVSRDYQVTGHTDSKPLVGPPFFDNWGLSLMRARQVLLFLTAPHEVTPKGQGPARVEPGGGLPIIKWSAAGYADIDPIAPNDTPEGMQRNRRVEIVILPNVEEMLDLRSLTEVSTVSPY